MRAAPRLIMAALVPALMAGSAGPVAAQRTDIVPAELEGIEITDRAGEIVPRDVRLVDERGNPVVLGDYLDRDRPVVLQFVYFDCPMLCNLVLNGFTEGARGINWTPGKEYTVISVSFDPADTPELALLKQANYVQSLERAGAEAGWHFLVGEPDEVRRLADSVGFPYRYVEDQTEFAHPAGIFVLAPDGRISRTLYGIEFKPQDLRFSLMEASQGRLGGPFDKVLLFCFRYDPDKNSYGLVAINVMKLGGLVTVLALGGFVGTLWYRERRRAPQAA